jgi:hypothetical protein
MAFSSKSLTGAYGLALERARFVALVLTILVALLWGAVSCFPDHDSGFVFDSGRFNADTLYEAVQMLFAEGSADTPVHWVLEILRVVAPGLLMLLALFTFLSAFATRARLAWMRWFRRPLMAILGRSENLVVIIGLGFKGLERAKSALEERNCSVVVLERDDANDGIIEVQGRGGIVWIGDAMNRSDLRVILWKRPTKVWVMTGDSRINLIVVNEIRNLLIDSGSMAPFFGKPPRVDIYACVNGFNDRRDAASLRPLNADTDNIWTHAFNHEESVAAWVVHKYPVREDADGVPRVLVVGLGSLGRALVRELMLVCHFPQSRKGLQQLSSSSAQQIDAAMLKRLGLPEIVAVDVAESALKLLLDELPFLREDGARGRVEGIAPFIATRLHREDAQQWVFEDYCQKIRDGSRFTHVFIALGAEVRNVALASRIWAWEKMLLDDRVEPPWIIPMIYDPEASEWDAIQNARTRVQPLLIEKAYSNEALKWDNSLREMGERVNEVYAKLFSVAAPKKWTDLLEHDRRSSLAQARYIFNRWFDPERAVWNPTNLAEIDNEAECEHRRWCAFQMVENIASVNEMNLPGYGRSVDLVSDRPSRVSLQSDKLRKWARVHADLQPFDKMNKMNRSKDYAFVMQHDFIKTGVGNPVGAEVIENFRSDS